MNNAKFTYRIGFIFSAILLWEIIFWGSFFLILYILGFFDDLDNHLSFKYPNALWLNLLLLPLGFVFYFKLLKNNLLSNKISAKLRPYFFSPISDFYTFLRFFFFRNTIAFLILTIAYPFYGNKRVDVSIKSMELVLSIDISNSMNTNDIDKKISRLEIAKRAIIQLINNLHGERLGIVVFAGGAYVHLPLTNDYHVAKMFVNEIQSNMISHQGTNIAQALTISKEMFSKLNTSKGIILVTDGENHEENPNKILNQIKNDRIQICVLGIGTNEGGLIPNYPNRPELGYKSDEYGQSIVSKVNNKFIHDIASKADGYSVISSSPFPELTELVHQINKMKRRKIADVNINVKETSYQLPLILAILFWTLYILLGNNLDKLLVNSLRLKK